MYLFRKFSTVITSIAILIFSLNSLPAFATGPDRELVVLNWSDYIDPALVAAFEKQFDVRVKEVFYESDDLRDGLMLETDGKGYDLVLVNGISVDTYRKRGWLTPWDSERIPNLKHIDSRWFETFPGLKGYAIPYFWGTVGIAYRSDLVPTAPTSWNDLFRPAEDLRGKIGMIDSARDVIGMALKALGHSANSTDSSEIEAAGRLLAAQRPFVRTYSYVSLNEDSALASGEIIATMMFNGDALMAQEHNEAIEYVLPKEGGNIWVDYLVVTADSKHKDLAWAFINFLNEPSNAAQLAQYVYYATPNISAENLLPTEFLEDPVIYPSRQALRKSEIFKPLSPRAMKKRNQIYSTVR